MSDKFDSFGKQLQELVTTINNIKVENSFLKEENCKLKIEVALLDKRMNVFEQKSIEKFVEIVGVSEVNNEDCIKTVESIAAAVRANISVSKAFRVHSKITNRSRKIVAELLSIQNKKSMMDNVKKAKLKGKIVNSNWKDENIYINDSLNYSIKIYFSKLEHLLVIQGTNLFGLEIRKFLLKKNENSKAFIINDEHSLSKLY